MNSPHQAGFDRARRSAQQRTTLALIATAGLAVCTLVAATAVSIGIARAEALAGAGSHDGYVAVGLLLAVIFAAMGGFTALTAMQRRLQQRR